MSINEVNVIKQPGLYRVESNSSTVYYVDTRGGASRFMRARGDGATGEGITDNLWVDLIGLESGPAEERNGERIADAEYSGTDVMEDTLRVGSRHIYMWRQQYWLQRTCTRIEALKSMPDLNVITK